MTASTNIRRTELSKAITLAKASAKTTKQQHVHNKLKLALTPKKGLALIATNYDVSSYIPVGSENINGEAETIVELDKFAAAAKAMGTRLTITIQDNAVVLTDGIATAEVKTLPTAEWPEDNGTKAGNYVSTVTMDGETLRQAMLAATTVASTDDSRPVLTGVKLRFNGNSLDIVATDSYRLTARERIPAKTTSGNPVGMDWLIPAAPLKVIAKAIKNGGTVVLKQYDHTLVIGTPNGMFRLRRMDGQFPNHKQLIRHPEGEVRFADPKAALATLKGVAKAVGRDKNPVKLTLNSDMNKLEVTHPVGVSTSIDLDHHAGIEDWAYIGANSKYLADLLNAAEGHSGAITLKFDSPARPMLLTSQYNDGTEQQHLLMPLRITD